MTFLVQMEGFQGPLEVLLGLIEKRKMSINTVSLSKVADDFISYVEKKDDFPVGESAHFILVASTLLLIKSKSLLPTIELTEDEQTSIEELELRLKIFKRIKSVIPHVKDLYGKKPTFSKSFVTFEKVFAPHKKITIENIFTHMSNVLAGMPKIEKLSEVVVEKVISLEEMISDLTMRIEKGLRTSFREVSGMGSQTKVHVIVSFLAVLELVKQGVVNVRQEVEYDEIDIETESVGVPRY